MQSSSDDKSYLYLTDANWIRISNAEICIKNIHSIILMYGISITVHVTHIMCRLSLIKQLYILFLFLFDVLAPACQLSIVICNAND